MISGNGIINKQAATGFMEKVKFQRGISVQVVLCGILFHELICDRQSVGQSVLVSGAYLGPASNFSFSSKFLLDSCGFIIL
jgi:hypothetical protein